MYLSDIDAQFARERYNDQVRRARELRLIRRAKVSYSADAKPEGAGSWLGRVFAALLAQRPARVWR